MGSEKLSQHVYDKTELEQLKNVPEIKETFESGNTNDDMQPNIWPSEEHIPGFRAHMETFFEKCSELVDQVLRALAVALNLDIEGELSSKHSRQLYQLRLAFYPSVSAALLRSGAKDRCAAHSDFGTITLLFQDANGGLEVEDPKQPGNFVPATPVPDTVIVNCGDLMERWSNGRWRAGVHRVVAPPVDVGKTKAAGEEILTSRYSIPYFAVPDPDALIEPLPGCWDEQTPKKYAPITVNDYIMMRMAAIR
jgi:isopenicillin N synthase-like dioxygenase